MTKLAISSWIVSKKMAQMDRKEVKKLRNLQLVAEKFKNPLCFLHIFEKYLLLLFVHHFWTKTRL